MRSTRSRFTIFIARWAILSGLAGTVFAALVLSRASGSVSTGSQRNLLLVAAVMLSLAFVLAPVVRRAFMTRGSAPSLPPARKTLLDEIREGEASATAEPAAVSPPQPSKIASRVLVGLYLMFGVVLMAVLSHL